MLFVQSSETGVTNVVGLLSHVEGIGLVPMVGKESVEIGS